MKQAIQYELMNAFGGYASEHNVHLGLGDKLFFKSVSGASLPIIESETERSYIPHLNEISPKTFEFAIRRKAFPTLLLNPGIRSVLNAVRN
jgi:hypothetical protein